MRVTVWNEYRHERSEKTVRAVYPEGMHAVIAEALRKDEEFDVATAVLDEPEHGLTEARLSQTDVLLWWGHTAHGEVADAVAERVCQHVLSGMGLIVLHSGHFSKVFRRLMGTNCSLRWREAGEKERLWNIAPGHEITQGIPDFVELPHSEMYGERFDIPEPDRLIFVSWYAGGDVFRSGCTFYRGHGKIFYFSPGHETYPIYHDATIQRILANACRWARPAIRRSTSEAPEARNPLERLEHA